MSVYLPYEYAINLVPRTIYQQPWYLSSSTLTGCNLNDVSVRKILKTQLRYEISYGLQLQSTKDQSTVLQFTRKQLLDNEMLNLHQSWDAPGLAKKIKSTGHARENFYGTFCNRSHCFGHRQSKYQAHHLMTCKGKVALFANFCISSSTSESGVVRSDVLSSRRLVSITLPNLPLRIVVLISCETPRRRQVGPVIDITIMFILRA